MGWILVNENDLRRTRVLSGSMTTLAASRSLGVSDRQTRRLLERMRSDGAGALAHRSRGRTPNNVTPDALRAHVLTLVRTQYVGFGPTFAAEKLLERDGIQVSRETLRKWMRDDGIWLTRS